MKFVLHVNAEPGHLPKPGIKPTSPASPTLAVESLPMCHLKQYVYTYTCNFIYKILIIDNYGTSDGNCCISF